MTTDTPRTDAEIAAHYTSLMTQHDVGWTDGAILLVKERTAKLEAELTAAKAEAAKWRAEREQWRNMGGLSKKLS